MPAPSERELYVCDGSSCRKARKGDRRLPALAETVGAEVRLVRCQKICESPVVGARVEGRLEWFERVRSDKALAALGRLLDGGALEKPLRKRRVAKRSGRLRE